jgi:hypothetical protein
MVGAFGQELYSSSDYIDYQHLVLIIDLWRTAK